MSKTNLTTRAFTANSQNTDIDVTDADIVVVSVSGTYALTLSFFVSDDGGTTWFPFNMLPTNSATPAATHSSANATAAYTGNVTPFNKFRVGTTAFTSGTANAKVTTSLQPGV